MRVPSMSNSTRRTMFFAAKQWQVRVKTSMTFRKLPPREDRLFAVLPLAAGNLLHEKMNEMFEAFFELDGFENCLAFQMTRQKRAGDQIRHLVGIGQVFQVFQDVFRGKLW